MHYAPRKRGHALARIHNAIQSATGYGLTDDNAGGGGGAADDKSKVDDAKKDAADKSKEPEKLTLTAEELERKISDAKAEAKRDADAERKREEAKAAKEKAKEEGDKDALLKASEEEKNAEKARADAAEAKAKRLELHGKLRAHLDEHHAELAKAAPVIAKLIDETAADDDADKAIKAAVAEYEKSLPEKPKGSAGAPAGIPRAGNRAAPSTSRSPRQPVRPPSVATSRF